MGLTLESPAFVSNAFIPSQYTCTLCTRPWLIRMRLAENPKAMSIPAVDNQFSAHFLAEIWGLSSSSTFDLLLLFKPIVS